VKNAEGIFSDLKVVDFASYIAGPAATTILSDFGATVIKVEPPGVGDPYRHFYKLTPNPVCEHNCSWQLTNRNKRSIALDLKAPEAKDLVAVLRAVPCTQLDRPALLYTRHRRPACRS